MTVDIAAQQAALLQAAALGLAAGLLYDLFRVLRCRVCLPLLGPALDLLFWLVLTGVLFLWSQWAWGRPSAAVWGRVPLPGRGALFPAVQPLDAVFGLSYRRFDNLFVGDPGPSVVCTKSDVQKTQKTCKKYLPFCWEMV